MPHKLKSSYGHEKKFFPRLSYLVGIVCFTIHLGLIIHHTYCNASQKDTRLVPPAHKYAKAEPQRWHNFLDLNRWDSAHYETIVLKGYRDSNQPNKPQFRIQWFPGYPLLAKCVHWLTGWKVTFIFSLLSASCTLAFWLIFWSPKMFSFFGSKVLATSSILILSWPGAFFWFAGMTEPLVGLILIILIYLWFSGSFKSIVAVLCYATAVKQVFIPVTIAVFTLEILRSHPKPLTIIIKGLIALAGFIAFGLYCWIFFDNFFIFSDLSIAYYQKKISLFSLIDLPFYARFIWKPGGMTAFSSMFLLLIFALRLCQSLPNRERFLDFFKQPQKNLSIELVLWWMALAYTSFCILGDAYARFPFSSIMRYQTVNIPIIFLFSFLFREMSWGKIVCIMIPLSWVFLFWQNIFTVQYWLWEWVA